MHELSLAGGVLDLVEEAARREGFGRVVQLRLVVGKLSGVEVGSLRFALGVIAAGTCLEGATVVIDEPSGRAQCLGCGGSTVVDNLGEPCAHCGGFALQPEGGAELRVADLLVGDD